MNINDDLTQVLKKINELSEQVFHQNEEEDEVKHTLEIRAREARDREIAEKFQDEEWEISKLEQLKQVEINRQNDDGGWHFDELKKIEKESKNRKSELRRLRAAATPPSSCSGVAGSEPLDERRRRDRSVSRGDIFGRGT